MLGCVPGHLHVEFLVTGHLRCLNAIHKTHLRRALDRPGECVRSAQVPLVAGIAHRRSKKRCGGTELAVCEFKAEPGVGSRKSQSFARLEGGRHFHTMSISSIAIFIRDWHNHVRYWIKTQE